MLSQARAEGRGSVTLGNILGVATVYPEGSIHPRASPPPTRRRLQWPTPRPSSGQADSSFGRLITTPELRQLLTNAATAPITTQPRHHQSLILYPDD